VFDRYITVIGIEYPIWGEIGRNIHLDIHQGSGQEIAEANYLKSLEAATGFEPVNNGFADRCLTTWLCRPGGTP
jgi:hypothetical protein